MDSHRLMRPVNPKCENLPFNLNFVFNLNLTKNVSKLKRLHKSPKIGQIENMSSILRVVSI